jgi:RNA polymerase sigma-70 factor (ECF subfamily)
MSAGFTTAQPAKVDHVHVQALVVHAQAGDRAAFGELYEIFLPRIYSYTAHHLYGRVEAAEDVTADVFMKALRGLGKYKLRQVPFSAWLYRIAHNCVMDYFRAAHNLPLVALDGVERTLSIEDRTDTRLDRYTLTSALAQITAEQRQVVVMRVVQGLTIAETAKATGKTDDAVKQMQSRGLKALRRVLDGSALN